MSKLGSLWEGRVRVHDQFDGSSDKSVIQFIAKLLDPSCKFFDRGAAL